MARFRLMVASRLGLAVGLILGSGAQAAAQSGYDLLVSSSATNSVKRYDGVTGAYVDDFIANGTAGLSGTQEVLLGPDDVLYVTGLGNTSILRFDRTGTFLGAFTTGYNLAAPTKTVFADDGMLYVSQWGQGQTTVARFDATTGAYVDEATPTIDRPMQMAFDPSGTMYVTSFGSGDVRRFDADGSFAGIFSTGGSLQGPVNLWFDSDGDLLVIDWQVGTVKRYDGATGAFKSNFITGMTNAEGYAYGPDGRLYIADWSQDLVNAYDSATGGFDQVFARGGGLEEPNSLLFIERFPDFRLTLDANTLTTTAGTAVTTTVMIDPDRDLDFDDPVDLTCAGNGVVSCSFSPAQVVPGADGATSTLTLGPPSASLMLPVPVLHMAWLSLAGVLGLLWWRAATTVRPRRRQRRLIWIGAAGLVMLGIPACGSTTAPETDQVVAIQIQGTSGDLVRSASLSLTISR